jgi:hypothetical protein
MPGTFLEDDPRGEMMRRNVARRPWGLDWVNRVAAFAAHGSNSLKADSLPCASFTLSAVSRCNIARAGTWSYSMNSSIEVRLPAPRTTDLTPHEIKTAVATSPAHLPSRIGRL